MARHWENTIRVPAPTDGVLYRIGAAYLAAVPTGKVTLHYAPHVTEEVDIDELQERGAAGSNDRRIFRMAMVTAPHGHVAIMFERTITVAGQGGFQAVPSAYEAEFLLEGIAHIGNQKGEVLTAIWNNLDQVVPASGTVPPQLLDVFIRQAQTLSEQTLANNSDLTRARQALESEVLERKKLLDEQAEERKAAFEAEVEERRQAILVQEEELRNKIQDVDDRRARHARREHRESITRQIQNRLLQPAASQDVQRHRSLILVISLMGFATAVASATFAGFELSSDSSTAVNSAKFAVDGVRFFASSLLATVLLFYALGYWRKIEREDAQFGRDMERFSLDIDRASWVVETVMEFRDEKIPGEVPDVWLHGATSRLFNSNPDLDDEDPNALEALAELLRKGARVQIGPNGAELEVSGKSAEKVGKSVKK